MAATPKTLHDYQLGDCLGKGAFGQVYRALNWSTGETVAVKEIQLSNIPKSELGQIMSEIDLLKNLNHPNIVKYKGFVKTREYLYIILEFCENGSLHAIVKRFGKFPEGLVAVYLSQVLSGLVYLHDQGVIHRDIKGANILTNKDGTVKLADFGVASSTVTGAVSNDAVVGSPYWMAPEVIEQSGATTASDIWSVGCLVIELLEGAPPYSFLDPMPALFRIVSDDCPPIPEGASQTVKDFLYHCFQKDCNLRVSAKKLLRHPWIANARKQMGIMEPRDEQKQTKPEKRPLSNYNHDEALLKVQEWNQALNSPSRPSKHPPKSTSASQLRPEPPSPTAPSRHSAPRSNDGLYLALPSSSSAPAMALTAVTPSISLTSLSVSVPSSNALGKATLVEKMQPYARGGAVLQQPEEQTDNWDDDFEEGISLNKIQALEKPPEAEQELTTSTSLSDDTQQTIKPGAAKATSRSARPPAPTIAPIAEVVKLDDDDPDDYSDDLGLEEDEGSIRGKVSEFKKKSTFNKPGKARGLFHPDDIKIFAASQVPPPPMTAPLPATQTKRTLSKRPSLAPLIPSSPPGPASASSPTRQNTSPFGRPTSHARSSSFVGPSTTGRNGRLTPSSLGPADARRTLSATEFEYGKYIEDDEEDEDYADVFGADGDGDGVIRVKGEDGSDGKNSLPGTLQLNTRLSNRSWGDGDSDEEDPFAEIDSSLPGLDDLEANLQRDKHARLCNQVNSLIDELTPSAPDFQVREACETLFAIISESPEMQIQLVSSHGMLALLEVLESKSSRDVILQLLQIVNLLVTVDIGFLESFCLIGGIPVIMDFTSKKYPSECRLEASHFIRLLCHSSVLTLQMFISCRGLRVLVDLLDEDYLTQSALVVHALNGIGSVFLLQSPTTKNDFCRMFIREGLLDPLSAALLNVMTNSGEMSKEIKFKIIEILLVFCKVSQNDIHVRNALGTRRVIRRLLRACELLEPECLVLMLKAIKHLSMNSTVLEVLQNANTLEILIRILDEQSSGPHSTEMANHIFQTCYNLCRLNKSRQEEAAQVGIIPCLKRVIDTNSPLKQFALPILCDLASAGKSCRKYLWQNGGLEMYLKLLEDPYFQVSALDAILSWLQDDPARVEDELIKPGAIDALLNCFVTAKATSFEQILDPFVKMTRMSTPITLAYAKSPSFFNRLTDRLTSNSKDKAVVRLNLLRILRAVCEVHPNRAVLVEKYGLLGVVQGLSRSGGDGAVLVRELAREIVPILKPSIKPLAPRVAKARSGVNGSPMAPKVISPVGGIGGGGLAPKRMRRSASETSSSTISGSLTARYDVKGGEDGTTSKSRASSRQRLEDIPWNSESRR